MEFQHEPNRIFYEQDGKLLAEVTFTDIDDHQAYVIDRTFVSDELRGQGVAGQLIKAVVDLARQEHKLLEPLCTYARHAFDTHPEYADVLRPTPEA
ncbi:GNAT family N-acetyltransferase [Lacticaseibacillus jixiensis]|uniref:GNAT family N-acetyltransferase n=1 Tax=Lacticaseibacillus jixiensis TaxID=3231926 RepID=UPI0036F2FE94